MGSMYSGCRIDEAGARWLIIAFRPQERRYRPINGVRRKRFAYGTRRVFNPAPMVKVTP
jgi:hypothetical protein